VGLWRPLILLPASWLTEMTPEVLEAVISHELAHVRRWDLWVNLLQRLTETLLFYHPAVWWLSRRVSLEREKCTDELAVAATGEPLMYATALEHLGRNRLGQAAPQFGAGMGGKKMVLLDRVRNVLGLTASQKKARWWPVGLLGLLAPLAIWAASTGIVRPEPDQTQANEATDAEAISTAGTVLRPFPLRAPQRGGRRGEDRLARPGEGDARGISTAGPPGGEQPAHRLEPDWSGRW